MELLWNAGRLTDIGAIISTILLTVAIILPIVRSKAFRADPEHLVWPPVERRKARRLADAADLAAANEAGR